MSRPIYELGKHPYVIICNGPWDMPEIGGHGHVVLTDEEYIYQMDRPDSFWKCPLCGYGADFDDANSDAYYDREEILWTH
jgi:hypothetical protein